MKNAAGLFLLGFAVLILWGVLPCAHAQDDKAAVMMAILKDKPQDLENGQFQIDFSPYYSKYKSSTNDWYSAGILLKADVGPGWEVSMGNDFLSYQNPDFGVSDLYLGAKWKFYEKSNLAIALSGYVDLPTGDTAFREPGIEPTLSLLVSKKAGDFDIGFSIGSTYASDSTGEPCYFDLEMILDASYALDLKNTVGAFVSGYDPDRKEGGKTRLMAGGSYTRTVTENHAVSLMVMKGLSDRGMDWACTVSYSFTFDIPKKFFGKDPMEKTAPDTISPSNIKQ
jgi:hypothetical protein